MNMTSEQKNLLTVIMNNRVTLEELLKAASTQQKWAKDLQMKESISIAGITWSKFAEDSEGNAYMLADEKICDMKFGENNDWRESPIREKLNDELYQKIVTELGADALITIQTDLFSHDGLRDYGKCEDTVSLLTYDFYRNNRENIKSLDSWFWTCTPDSTPSGCGSDGVRYVYSGGSVCCGWCDGSGAVRPFFILKSDIFVSCEETEA
ncbi:MAG: hypothetical protein HDQ99_02640 [Lachnospiraceae bacterium]|nr:hypothetical protein [Lachnospiraceae bacterium]